MAIAIEVLKFKNWNDRLVGRLVSMAVLGSETECWALKF